MFARGVRSDNGYIVLYSAYSDCHDSVCHIYVLGCTVGAEYFLVVIMSVAAVFAAVAAAAAVVVGG